MSPDLIQQVPPGVTARELSYQEAIREALREEMQRDPSVFLMGEDIGKHGGAFGVTRTLFDQFGARARAECSDLGEYNCWGCHGSCPGGNATRDRDHVR